MLLLKDIEELAIALKSEKVTKIKLLHQLIFENEGDRKNRERLRNFSGFGLPPDSDELKSKVEKIIADFSLNQLITIANVLQILNEGNIEELTTRVVSSLNDLEILKCNIIKDENSDTENVDDEDNESVLSNSSLRLRENSGEKSHNGQFPLVQEYVLKSHTSFSEFESFVAPFKGTNVENIETWFENFEDSACLLNLTELQKLIFAKRCIQEKAKLYIDSEIKIHSYAKLKALMLAEFGDATNSADIHEMLSKRKMRCDETIDEYFLIMKKISNKCNIEDAALIKYIINGIQDDAYKKASLYGCTNLKDFKVKLKIYEQIKIDDSKNKPPKFKFDQKPRNDKDKYEKDKFNYENRSNHPIRVKNQNDRVKDHEFQSRPTKRDATFTCFRCGEPKHLARHCPNKDKGNKCFNCSEWGHRSFECPKRNHKPEVATIDINTNSKLKVPTKFNGLNIDSIIDTGSPVTLLQKRAFDKLDAKLYSFNSTLSGFGKCQIKPLGYFKCNIEIDALECTADVCVVENEVMTNEAIIGLSVLMQGEVTISGKGVVVKNKCPK